MSLHIIKLCVGVRTAEDLSARQRLRLSQGNALYHRTRMMPKRRDELLKGGSIYWVIAGQIMVRQPLIDIVPVKTDDGISRCDLMLDPTLVFVRPTPKRAFQGWRYLAGQDAPPDLGQNDRALMHIPEQMRADLSELCLI